MRLNASTKGVLDMLAGIREFFYMQFQNILSLKPGMEKFTTTVKGGYHNKQYFRIFKLTCQFFDRRCISIPIWSTD